MNVHPDLRDVADLLVLSAREAGVFCSEVAWHLSDRPITYAMIADALDAHPHTDPTPEMVARWIAAAPPIAIDDELEDPVAIEYEPPKKPSIIQRRDFRDAQAGFKKCPHGIPITQRCRICRPQD